ncbi:hypothetical protein FHN55_05955 [Streptomyces sp. NP160]|uniref:hypothetical protein n=1 Tax=Streptomyces sp. NP160 TaxID=2586637 RepID=UPI00111853EE|nr:hypothetical protein [Streptomyces sp. NP160]TNM68754.1 hypothetical protein FHN55_05955 [Streptomyces sp. NP160]
MALGQRGDGAGDVELLDLDQPVDDLDDDDERASPPRSAPEPCRGGGSAWSRWPEAVPGWARGPAAVVVLVLAAGLGGAAVGSSHRDALDQQASLQRALTVGSAFVAAGDDRGGVLAARVHVELVNHADTALDVQLQGLSTPHQGTAAPPEAVEVEQGAVVVAPLGVQVDCAAVRDDPRTRPPTAQPASPFDLGPYPTPEASSPTVVLASVRPAGGGQAVDVQLPVVDSLASSLAEQLGQACGASSAGQLQTGWLWQDDGGLRVSVTSPPDAAPVRLQLDSTAGLDPTSDPPLPRDLRPGETAVLDLEVHPRCAVVGDGALSRLDLQAVDGDGTTTSLGQAFDATTPVAGTPLWLARQVALACG